MVLFFLSWFTSPHTKPIDEKLLNIKPSRRWKSFLSFFCASAAFLFFWGFPPSVKPWQCPFTKLCCTREGKQLPRVLYMQSAQPWQHPGPSLSQECLNRCFPWTGCAVHEWTQTDLRGQLMSHSFHVVISYFQRKEASLQWEQFYLSPLVGADVAQGCSSPRAEEQGPVRPPAPPHLCHQALEQGCDHSSAAGPALPTIALQTAVVATDDDVSVWNEE